MLRPFPTRAFLAALLCYALWSRDLAREVLARIDRALPSDIVDPLLNTLVLDWNSRHLPLTDAWWQFPMFAPLAGVTTFTEHLLGISLFASPLVWMTGSPVTAYNLMFVAAPVFASAAMFALAWHLTRDAWASAIAGFTFGFPLYGAGQVSHLQMFITGWMPLVLLGLHRYFEEGRARWLALVGVGWLLTAASNGYFLVFFGVLVGLWLAWFGLRARSAGRLVVAGAVLVVASLPLVPLLAHYAQVHRSYGFARWAHEIEVYSADVSALLRGSPRLSLWGGRFPPVPTEVSLFPGVTFAALAAGGAWRVLARTEAAARWRWRHVLLAFAALALVAGLVILWTGGWRGSVLGLRVSMGRAEKAFGVAAAFAVAWMATGARSRAAWRRADAGVFYAWAAFATWLFALGPRPHLAAAPLLHAGPYQLLLMLPGGDALRVPSRFWTMTLVCLAVLAAFGVQAARGRLGGAARWAVPLALVALLASESHYRVRAAVLPSRALDNDVTATDALVLEFPMGDYRDLLSVYRAIHGGDRPVNGYRGYYPPRLPPAALHAARLRTRRVPRRADRRAARARPGARRHPARREVRGRTARVPLAPAGRARAGDERRVDDGTAAEAAATGAGARRARTAAAARRHHRLHRIRSHALARRRRRDDRLVRVAAHRRGPRRRSRSRASARPGRARDGAVRAELPAPPRGRCLARPRTVGRRVGRARRAGDRPLRARRPGARAAHAAARRSRRPLPPHPPDRPAPGVPVVDRRTRGVRDLRRARPPLNGRGARPGAHAPEC